MFAVHTISGAGTLPEHPSSPPVFSWVRVTRSKILCVCFVDRCLSFCTFSFGHCVVCSSSIYGFWLSPWYLQTLLIVVVIDVVLVVVIIIIIIIIINLPQTNSIWLAHILSDHVLSFTLRDIQFSAVPPSWELHAT